MSFTRKSEVAAILSKLTKISACLLLLSSPASLGEVTVRVAATTAPGTPWYDSWMHFKQALATSKADLEPRFYLAGQLGSEESALSQLRRGRIQLAGVSLQGASSVVPELGLLMSPYLFASYREVDCSMDGFLLQAFDKLFADKGLILLSWAEVGWTNLYFNRAVAEPADSEGLKLRSSNALASQLLVQSIGADMVPLPFQDIMPSLQTGLIQGGESGTIFYALTGLPAQAPHLTLTRHAFDTGMYLANRQWFETLSSRQQDSLRQSLMPANAFRELVRQYEVAILDQPDHYGIEVYQPNNGELQAWRSATANNRLTLAQKIGGDSAALLEVLEEAGRECRQDMLKAGTRSAQAAVPQSPGLTTSVQ